MTRDSHHDQLSACAEHAALAASHLWALEQLDIYGHAGDLAKRAQAIAAEYRAIALKLGVDLFGDDLRAEVERKGCPHRAAARLRRVA